jgi:hypothetical protein
MAVPKGSQLSSLSNAPINLLGIREAAWEELEACLEDVRAVAVRVVLCWAKMTAPCCDVCGGCALPGSGQDLFSN